MEQQKTDRQNQETAKSGKENDVQKDFESEKEKCSDNEAGKPVQRTVKSPSDTTLYAPLLRRNEQRKQPANEIINQISNFVESVRIANDQRGDGISGQTPLAPDRFNATHLSRKEHPRVNNRIGCNGCRQSRAVVSAISEEQRKIQEARGVAEQHILDAEKFRASINAPQGMCNLPSNINIAQLLDNDDDFFHVTCHVEQSLKDKIEKGEYVDLERLMPKNKPGISQLGGDGSRMEWVTKDGMTFLAPVQEKEFKITGIRRWEQAFRVYAAIYTKANPHRASEIWQYVYTINTAASSYHWENVAFYDNTFRHLMSERPWCSWSKTYTQGWNLALKNPINKSASYSGEGSSNYLHNNFNQGQTRRHRDWCDNCCWRYNKNRCSKNADNCHFDTDVLIVEVGIMDFTIAGND